MPQVVEFTAEKCYSCPETWAGCTAEQRTQWGNFISSVTHRPYRVCHKCAAYYQTKATNSSSSNHRSGGASDTSVAKLVSGAQRGTSRAPIRAISHNTSTNQQLRPGSGYTPNHALFKQEETRYRKLAGGFTGGSTPTVQVKVTMMEPITRGTKVVFAPVHQDLWDTISVPANIEVEMLRRTCIEKLYPMWDKWSCGYPIHDGDATVYACVTGGHKKLFGDSCILDLFQKKPRGSTAVANYNFASIPELVLHFPSGFYQEVATYREDKENLTQPNAPAEDCVMDTIGHKRAIRPLPRRKQEFSAASTTHASVWDDQVVRKSVRGLERSLSNVSLDIPSQRSTMPRGTKKRAAPDSHTVCHQDSTLQAGGNPQIFAIDAVVLVPRSLPAEGNHAGDPGCQFTKADVTIANNYRPQDERI